MYEPILRENYPQVNPRSVFSFDYFAKSIEAMFQKKFQVKLSCLSSVNSDIERQHMTKSNGG